MGSYLSVLLLTKYVIGFSNSGLMITGQKLVDWSLKRFILA